MSLCVCTIICKCYAKQEKKTIQTALQLIMLLFYLLIHSIQMPNYLSDCYMITLIAQIKLKKLRPWI